MSDWEMEVSGIAANYERYLVPRLFGPTADMLLERVKPEPGQRVLDVACGTGVVARKAAGHVGAGGRVAGIDMTPDMLEAARATAPTDPHVEWRQASADHMPFDDGDFDLVLCQHAMQFFPDKPAALREMRRVMADGGRLGVVVLSDLGRQRPLAALVDALERHIGPAPGAFVRMIAALGNESELRGLVEDAGFRDVSVEAVAMEYRFPSPEWFVRHYIQSTPLAANPAVAGADEAARAGVEHDFSAALADYVDADGVRFPAENLVATAIR